MFSMQQGNAEGTCRYQQSCHFYNISRKNDSSSRLRELYCVKWPEQCKIHQTRHTGAPVPITLWPTGKVS
jgi:hypothetical protein